MNNAKRQAPRAASSYLRQTLPVDPEAQWILRRQSIGLTFTLPVDMESQAVLLEERRLALANIYQEIESS